MHRFWKWLKLIAPAPKPGRLLTPVRKQTLSPTTHVHAQIREDKHSCWTWNSELSNSLFSFLLSLLHSSIVLVRFEFALFLSALINFLFCLLYSIFFPFDPSISPGFEYDLSFVAFCPRHHHHHRFSFAHSPFPPFATPPPLSARSDQPGRALTWCTTTCWLTWTGPAWTCQAAVAACQGQNCPLTSRRTLTMTPSGPATVTGWVRCRVRAASLTRTKRTVLTRCNVMWCAACLPLIFGVSEETSVDLFCIYLFFMTYFFIFVNLFVLFIFEKLILRYFMHLPVALPLSLLCASSLHVVAVSV